MSKHALIGGGTGFIGSRLTGFLKNQGYSVTIISRMPGLGRISWHELQKNGVPKGVNAVVNVAGQNVLDPTRRWTPGFKQNVWNSRVNTSSALAHAISQAKDIDAFVNISGVSHYKPRPDKVYTECDKVEEFDYMSRLCIAWEKAATLAEPTNTRLVKIRTGVVVGREGGMIQSMWIPFQFCVGGPLGDGKQILPWIHIEDLCRLIQYGIENKNMHGVFNGVAPEIVTNEKFCKTFASALRRPCIFSVPKLVVETIYGKDRSALVLTGAKIEPKASIENGFKFKYPTCKEACEEVVQNSKLAIVT